MPRNLKGKFTVLNTFVPGTTITALSHNENWADAANEISNSIAADGQTPLTGPLQNAAGSPAAPSVTFSADLNTGMFRAGADILGFSAGGVSCMTLSGSSAVFTVPIDAPLAALPSGTRMLFHQSNAPPGWVKDVNFNDRALRVVTGGIGFGGTVAFSTFLARTSTDVMVLSAANLPPHKHSGETLSENANHTHSWGGNFNTAGSGSLDHTHNVTVDDLFDGQNNTQPGGNPPGGKTKSKTFGTAGVNNTTLDHAHNIDVSGTTGVEQHEHIHGFTTDGGPGGSVGFFGGIDCRIAYTDVIIAQRA